MHTNARILFSCFLFLSLLLPSALSQGVGIGIDTYLIVFNGTVFDSYTVSPRIINPSNYELKAKVYFECRNCVHEVRVLGYKLAEKVDDPNSYFVITRNDVTVPARSIGNNGIPVVILFSPHIITKKYLKVYTPEFLNFFIRLVDRKYDGSFTLPYFALFIGEKKLNGLLVADVYWSSFGSLGVTPSVGASLEMTAMGIPLSSFIFFVVIILLLVVFLLKKRGVKLPFKTRKKR